MAKNTFPNWIDGVQSGFDTDSKKWRTSDGKIVSKVVAQEQLKRDIDSMGFTASLNRDRLSQAASDVENYIGANFTNGSFSPFSYEDVMNGQKGGASTHMMIPGQIVAAYRLAQFYWNTEGDVASALELPIQMILRPIDVRSSSPDVKKMLEEMYDVDGLNLFELARGIMISTLVFGIAHPYEVYEGTTLRGVPLLPPMYTTVNSKMQGGGLLPTNGDSKWTQQLLESQLPELIYRSYTNQLENAPSGALALPDGAVNSIRATDLSWVKYPKPPMSGAFRALSTRIIYEEMRRAVYEGFRHQLWAFLVGDAEHRPSPEIITKLRNDVTSMSGERTGSLVWWGGLRIEVHAPKTDNIMASQEWWMLSLDIFRRLGLSMRGATGNTVPEEKGNQFDLDISIMLEKVEFIRQLVMQWERGFRIRYAKKQGDDKLVEEMRKADVKFSLNAMELKTTIEDRLKPLFTIGALSTQSLLTQAGQNYAQERANKIEVKESGEQELWYPAPTYNQTTSIGGEPKKETATTNAGRPQDSVNKNKQMDMEASIADEVEEKKKKYIVLLLRLLDREGSDPTSFVSKLKDANKRELKQFAMMGYKAAGGMNDSLSPDYENVAANFVNSFADQFGADMKSGKRGNFTNEERTAMYADEGVKMAFLHGVQAAMNEKKATHWRRVLSFEGGNVPCPLCVEDSRIIHPISEPFLILHPNEMCSAENIKLSFGHGGGITEFGVRGITKNDVSDLLRNLTKYAPVTDDVVTK